MTEALRRRVLTDRVYKHSLGRKYISKRDFVCQDRNLRLIFGRSKFVVIYGANNIGKTTVLAAQQIYA